MHEGMRATIAPEVAMREAATGGAGDRARDEAEVFAYWEKTKDLVDQLIDIVLNYRQSGHPGGSRSKVHALLVLMLSGIMRWDIRRPEKRFADRFVLAAGHAAPAVYAVLAILHEALRVKLAQTGDSRYAVPQAETRALTWEDLLSFRRRGGLAGHAEMAGKTLFFKYNTGPSGHGAPAAAGQALALQRAGAGCVRVFVLDGEAGLTPGAVHETMNSAWGLALDNLCYIVDWNDFGIDAHPVSQVVYARPTEVFASHGWKICEAQDGASWGDVLWTLRTMVEPEETGRVPRMACLRTQKGRGYLKTGSASHGSPHAMNSELFWATKRPFTEKYGATFRNDGGRAPEGPEAIEAEFRANLEAVIEVLRADAPLVDYLAETLLAVGDSVPEEMPGCRLGRGASPFDDDRLFDVSRMPENLFVSPGTRISNRAAFAAWGSWVNALGAGDYGRPVFLASSADLAESTGVSGFGKPCGAFPGYGVCGRAGTTEGVVLPQEITEFANAGISCGLASVNFARDPERAFDGFWSVCSTYGAFAYLKYGPFRLHSQLVQDCPWRTGKVLWVLGHSGPETADDSRTHFGIFSPGVTQLFPRGHILNLHPWEHNEVPVMLAAALRLDVPIVALHLTRPPVEVPDRRALGIPSHLEAARGAYVLWPHDASCPPRGTIVAQGSSAVAGLVEILPQLRRRGLNVKIVCATSRELFERQPPAERDAVLTPREAAGAMVVTTQARRLMRDWGFDPRSETYAVSPDADDRWRTGGTLDEVLDEAGLTPARILDGIERYVREAEELRSCAATGDVGRLRRSESEFRGA
ncbi:MAG: transketolase [Candidatus Bipolaricaulota bacterium]